MAKNSERSFPFDAEEIQGEYDREYKADEFAEYFRAFISSGVFMADPDNLQVIANGDMSVTLRPGRMIIDGYRYTNLSDIKIQISPADGKLDRIDRIAITWGLTERENFYTIREGELAYNPTPPICRRSEEYKDYVVADIRVKAGAISISQSDITDRRLNQELCGLATPFYKLDLSALGAQLETFYRETIERNTTWEAEQKAAFTLWYTTQKNTFEQWSTLKRQDYETWTEDQKTQFAQWFDKNTTNWETELDEWLANLKENLSDNAAINLQLQVDDLTNQATALQQKADNYFFDARRGAIAMDDLNNFASLKSGCYYVNYANGSDLLTVFAPNGGSASALQFYSNYPLSVLKVRGAIDNNRYTDWKFIAFATSNVASATKLQTARLINGVAFDGTRNINLPLSDSVALNDSETFASAKAVKTAYDAANTAYNSAMHLIYSGKLTGTDTQTLQMRLDATYLFFTREVAVSSKQVYGYRARVYTTGKGGINHKAPTMSTLAQSTNSGVSISTTPLNVVGLFGIQLRASSESYEVSYSLYELANSYGNYLNNGLNPDGPISRPTI